jgi:hypothetical protein
MLVPGDFDLRELQGVTKIMAGFDAIQSTKDRGDAELGNDLL